MSSESDSTTSNIDSEAIDETYNLSSKDIETLVADDLLAQEMADDLVKKSTKRSLAGKRKDNENTLKIQVAEEVGKHPNLFDINNKNYMNRSKDSESWNAVSTNVGIDVSKCKAIWESLKRGARYHGKATKMPYKSGAGTDDPDVCSKKKKNWEFGDAMAFYTPPSLRPTETLVSVFNQEASTPAHLSASDDATFDSIIDDSSNVSMASAQSESVYVSKFVQYCSNTVVECLELYLF